MRQRVRSIVVGSVYALPPCRGGQGGYSPPGFEIEIRSPPGSHQLAEDKISDFRREMLENQREIAFRSVKRRLAAPAAG